MRLSDYLRPRRRRERDLEDEIAAHLALAAKDRVESGADPHEARLAALKEFGNVTLTREATRMTWRHAWVERAADWGRDIGYASRLLRRSPAYSLVVIAVLALGIACNVMAFSLYKALALAPLAGVPDSGSLHYVGGRTAGGELAPISYLDYAFLRDNAYPDLAFWGIQPLILGQGADGKLVSAEFVPGNYFDTLQVRAQLGRTLTRGDEVAPGRHPVVVIADHLWRRAFGADPHIVGKTIRLNAHPLTVVGVAPAEFRGAVVGISTDLFVPVMMLQVLTGSDWLDNRANRAFHAFTRLRPGVGRPEAEAQAEVVAAALAASHPLDWAGQRAAIVPIWEWPYGAQTYMLPVVTVIGAMAALLLVVVCANLSGLVLVRSLGRQGEIAARLALGASRGRVLRQLAIESVLLAIPGAAIGFLLPRLAEPFVGAAASNVSLPLYFNVYVDRFVVGFTLLLALVSVAVYGVAPAVRLSRVDLATAMQEGPGARGGSTMRLRTSLVVAQIAVSLMLLVGTGLALRTLEAAGRADAGFDPRQVTWATLDVRAGGHDERSGSLVYRRLVDALAADTRVESVSLAAYLPLTIVDWQRWGFVPEGYTPRRDEDLSFALNIVSPEYFRTMRTPLAAGREFDWRDAEGAAAVAIVNETFARRFFGSPEAAVGRRVEANGELITVVGVARNVKYARIDESPRPYVYLPFTQVYRPDMTVQVRTWPGATPVLDLIRRHADAIDPTLPILTSGSLADQVRSATSLVETAARILGIIGLVAVGMTGLGIYGLIAYTVRERAREIGIRSAVGAAPADIARHFVRGGARLGLLGVALGVVAALATTRLMRSVSFGVGATDPVSFAAATAAVLAVALVASIIPARRAARADPLTSLRHQ